MRKQAEIREAFAETTELDGKKSFFMVGIGGAGMSAVARMLKHRGFSVRGTDSTASAETERLIQDGIPVSIGHSGAGIETDDAVVLTDAIDLTLSPEVERAREIGAPMFRRSQVLGWLLKRYKVIAVTGTHGKTTTTGMIGAGLRSAEFDPLIVVGASVPDFGGPVVEGNGKWAVVEACEAYDSFHDIRPNIVVLTNLELDHVDFHGTYDRLRDSVVRFVNSAGKQGYLVYCSEDRGAQEIAELTETEAMPYGLDQAWATQVANSSGFGALAMADELHLDLALPGRHNRLNAAAALTAAVVAGAEPGAALQGIARFGGAERRLQTLYDADVTVIDDYAHHPTEIEASLRGLRDRYPDRRLIVAYQPHLYSRTEPLIAEFAKSLSEADLVVITDIYPAREDPIPGVSSARIAELVTRPVLYVPSRHLLPLQVARVAKSGDVVVGMGAGNISEFAPEFIKEWQRKANPNRTKKVLVAYAGDSSEREVSILSGRAIHRALEASGYESRLMDITELLLKHGDVKPLTGPDRPDLVFLAVHGTNAEDGAIQGLLELLHLPYTGSGIQASAIAMDKEMTKRVLASHGIRVPEGRIVRSSEEPIDLAPPLVVKPNAQGSTVGLSFVSEEAELKPAIERALAYGDDVLVEEWIKGMEISVPVLGDRALPPVEIAPVSGRYDFEAKYTPGATEEIVPARLPEAALQEARRLALLAHRSLGCLGATRTDMMVRNAGSEDAEIFVLEINTLPGMTGTSLLPNSAAAAGIPFEDLVRWLVEDALSRNAKKT